MLWKSSSGRSNVGYEKDHLMNNSWADNEGLLIMNCKMRIIAMLVALTIALAFVGCSHTRSTVMVTVDNLGPQIVTKDKYTLVYGDGMRVTSSGVTLERLIAAQPHVFCSNGIPIVVKHKFELLPKGAEIPIIPVLEPFILPVGGKGITYESDYTIDVLDCPDAHATFQKKSRDDGCFALLTPLPMLFYPTAGSFDGEPKNNYKFTRHFYSFGIGTGIDAKERNNMSEDATAYGIAVLLKQMEDSGKINSAKSRSAAEVQSQKVNLWGGYNFEVVDFHRLDSDSHCYEFSLISTNKNVSLSGSFAARRVLSDTIRHDFAASYPSANRTVLAVDFTQYEFAEGLIKGSATVMPLNVLAFSYDKHTRKGTMRIKIREDQFKAARQYVIQNIESVVRDKNIALIVGELPPDARFYLLDESVIEDVLEVNFRTE